jgi:hypothetical protein
MSSLIVRASGECSIQQVKLKHEKTHIQVQDTSRPKVDPKFSKIPVANEKSALDPIEPRIKLSIKRSTFQ